MAESEGATVLVVEDEEPYRELLTRRLGQAGYTVLAAGSGEEGLERVRQAEVDVAIVDLNLPKMSGLELIKRFRDEREGIESIMLTGKGGVEVAVEVMKLGAYHYLEKPVKFAELKLYVAKAAEKRRLAAGYRDLKEIVDRSNKAPRLIGQSKVMARLRELIARIAPNPTPVLIEGETGTGKDVCARLVHALSPRRDGPFIAINCGALAENLLENELFGHAKGAYTSADKEQRGVFEMADKGTLFIDELCEMSLETQKKFLRVLESGEFRRLGEARVRSADVRIVAATNRDVQIEVKEGRFRQDLYYRLNVLKLETPPLREHREDIPELVEFFLTLNAHRYPRGARVSPEAMSRLGAYHWPGNVRELQAVLERGAVLSSDGVIRPGDCPGLENSPTPRPVAAPAPVAASGETLTLEALEKRHVEEVLRACDGNKTHAARKLGISLRSLYRKLERHDIS